VSRTGRLVVYASCGSGRGVAFAFAKVSHAMDSPPPELARAGLRDMPPALQLLLRICACARSYAIRDT
jgi:hypothetical protein